MPALVGIEAGHRLVVAAVHDLDGVAHTELTHLVQLAPFLHLVAKRVLAW